jgi:hypothetical protein
LPQALPYQTYVVKYLQAEEDVDTHFAILSINVSVIHVHVLKSVM